MKKTLLNIVVLIAVVLVTMWGTRTYLPNTIDHTVTDTVKVNVPYQVKVFEEVEKPVRVTEYKTDTVRVQSVELKRDTVYVETQNSRVGYSPQFLTGYPMAPRFLGAKRRNTKLNFTYQTVNGDVEAKTWDLGKGSWEVGLTANGVPTLETLPPGEINYSHSIRARYLISNYHSPYIEYNAYLNVYGVTGVGSVNINKNPFGTVGVEYAF